MKLLITVFGLCMTFAAPLAAEEHLPYQSQQIHLGVASCSASTCHGSTIPRESNVEQNEYILWSDDEEPDMHYGAYETLFTDESKRIASNLGLESADTAEVCLACHADHVAEAYRGHQYTPEDGVGCEACHGGGERYVDAHYKPDATHARNLELGLYPTEDPAARAQLCLSCHFGNQDKFVTHRIMGAGHPRLSFELDTFTADQPAHYFVDEDYEERKRYWDAVQTWAIGQTIAAKHLIEAVATEGRTGMFPELTLFDCHSCHHSMKDLRWRPLDRIPREPGALRLNDANLIMTHQLSRVAAPELSAALHDGIRALHRAGRKSQTALNEVGAELSELLDALSRRLADYSFSADDMRRLIAGLVGDGMRGEYRDYVAAEQTVMAIGSILASLEEAGAIDETRGDAFFGALDKVYETLDNEDKFSPVEFQRALKTFEQAISG